MRCSYEFFLLSAFIFLHACSVKQIQTDGGDLTRIEVEYISRQLTSMVEAKFPPLKHKMVNRYIDSLGQSIVSHNSDMPPLPYEFRVLKSNEVHLFSLPGGVVYLTLGALRAFESEGQLVAAIAHELAHQQLAHPLITWRKRVNASREKNFPFSPDMEWENYFLGTRGFLYYGEGGEKEADQQSAVIMYRAQYDPRLMLAYLQALQKIEIAKPELVAATRTIHPENSKRIGWVKEILLKLPPQKNPKPSSASFSELKQILKEAELKVKDKRKND